MSRAHAQILEALAHSPGGMTDPDLELILRIPANTLRPRRRELVQEGRVRDSGLNRGGCIVWEIDPEGKPHPGSGDARAPRLNRLKLAARPLEAVVSPLVERHADLSDRAVIGVSFTAEMRVLREFLAAMEA